MHDSIHVKFCFSLFLTNLLLICHIAKTKLDKEHLRYMYNECTMNKEKESLRISVNFL